MVNFDEKMSKPKDIIKKSGIDRRTFIAQSAKCSACLAFLPINDSLENIASTFRDKNDTKKIFLKKGTCSQTFYFLLNREFKNNKEEEEHAIDPLAGGIMQKGYQCGMLLGATFSVGAESYRRYTDESQAIYQSVIASQHLIKSFTKKMTTTDCNVITNIDFSKKLSLLKMIFFQTGECFRLAKHWTSGAINAAHDGLSDKTASRPTKCMSCATELAKKMGASEEEKITVSGLAGGLGLSGNACGALAAAIWLKTLYRLRQNPEEPLSPYKEGEETIVAFEEETGNKYLCSEITGINFNSIDEHTEYIKNGGCSRLTDILAQANEVAC